MSMFDCRVESALEREEDSVSRLDCNPVIAMERVDASSFILD